VTRLFLAVDASVAVELEDQAIDAMLRACSMAGQSETGGILIGRYGEYRDRVIVSQATGPPRDSLRFPACFIRGVAGLAERLRVEWKGGKYYVGEWHFHPSHPPDPSGLDRRQISAFATDPSLNCPRPILLVVGGNPPDQTSIWAGVFGEGGLSELPEAEARWTTDSSPECPAYHHG
jgi:proteasome lid subunit RPN8/RPN11